MRKGKEEEEERIEDMMKMDYELPALKMLIAHLRPARPISHTTADGTPAPAMALGNLRFQRAWLQGMIVRELEGERVALDDGSGVIELFLTKQALRPWKLGTYVFVVGQYMIDNGLPLIKAHKIIDISTSPDREAMWNLEVIEAHHLFYASRIGKVLV
ncbi:hypothetical protein O6H91_17G088200 [Diphasiastrum complanatum]|uniref:Uncharacterized protein n=1 Tax=Diphasiastrum complanatum TaxID=34168 RepID=A0ACC2B8S7_DIPCM|nr:hypothetical protein O6H91_17G088200 [Diphasiastrum complanatum]